MESAELGLLFAGILCALSGIGLWRHRGVVLRQISALALVPIAGAIALAAQTNPKAHMAAGLVLSVGLAQIALALAVAICFAHTHGRLRRKD